MGSMFAAEEGWRRVLIGSMRTVPRLRGWMLMGRKKMVGGEVFGSVRLVMLRGEREEWREGDLVMEEA